jgi:hypothetical protein
MTYADIRLEYWSQSGNLFSVHQQAITDYTTITTWYDGVGGINHYYNVYLIDQTLPTNDVEAGFFRVFLVFRDESPQPKRRSFGLASFRVGANDDTFPDHCPIPNAELPATPPAATPTGTLPATWTPEPTPSITPTPIITPGATTVNITPLPSVTLTPFVFPTIEAESTPTPFPPLQLPTIVWPTVDAVTIVPAAATVSSTGGTLDTLADTIDSAWSTPSSFAGDSMSTTVTTTTGYNAPISLVVSLTQGISLPIAYAKGVADYIPNTSGFLAVLLSLAAWIMFQYIAKYSIQVVVFVFELLRRIWEAIPFF